MGLQKSSLQLFSSQRKEVKPVTLIQPVEILSAWDWTRMWVSWPSVLKQSSFITQLPTEMGVMAGSRDYEDELSDFKNQVGKSRLRRGSSVFLTSPQSWKEGRIPWILHKDLAISLCKTFSVLLGKIWPPVFMISQETHTCSWTSFWFFTGLSFLMCKIRITALIITGKRW